MQAACGNHQPTAARHAGSVGPSHHRCKACGLCNRLRLLFSIACELHRWNHFTVKQDPAEAL
eukprot:496029-Pelagomonas_calceolata.AAC.3